MKFIMYFTVRSNTDPSGKNASRWYHLENVYAKFGAQA